MSQSFKLLGSGFASAWTILSLSFTILAYKRAIEPLYASVPAQTYLNQAVFAGAALGSVVGLPLEKAAAIYGTLLAIAPYTAYWTALYSARWGDAVLGPVFTHALVLVPLIAAGVAMLHSTQGTSEPIGSRFTRLPFYCFVFPSLEPIWNLIPQLLTIPSTEIFLASAGIIIGTLVVSEGNSLLASEPAPKVEKDEQPAAKTSPIPRMALCAILTSLLAASFQYKPTLHAQYTTPASLPYTDANNQVRILSSVQSVTGMIVVGESLAPPPGVETKYPTSLRYLRASHSLLGGVWVDPRAMVKNKDFLNFDKNGSPLGDSIYATFVLQEAVRLVNSSSWGDDWKGAEALVIGLGAGVAPTALRKHGLHTTIVEIDPAVYDAARTYFGLPDPGEGRVFLEDARGWVHNAQLAVEKSEREPFDIIIHDCFSGGGVPSHIFTLEFWKELKGIVKPDGVVAVNFVGKPGSKASRAVLSTLLAAFGQCRAFLDSTEELTEEELKEQHLNLVIFCTPSGQLTFRPSTQGDYLASQLRKFILESLPRRELDLHVMLDSASADFATESGEQLLLTDLDNPLGEWQKEDGVTHWKMMREVLPDVFWETF